MMMSVVADGQREPGGKSKNTKRIRWFTRFFGVMAPNC